MNDGTDSPPVTYVTKSGLLHKTLGKVNNPADSSQLVISQTYLITRIIPAVVSALKPSPLISKQICSLSDK